MSAVDVGALDEFADGAARRVEVDGHRLAVIRLGDDLYAIGDRCTHADISLAEGEVDADEKTVECWKHGSAFSLETGEPLSLPAVRPVPTFTVRADGGRVLVEVEGAQP